MKYILTLIAVGKELRLVNQSQVLTNAEFGDACIELTGGGHNFKQLIESIKVRNQLRDDEYILHADDARGNMWSLESKLEVGEVAACMKRGKRNSKVIYGYFAPHVSIMAA